MNYVTFVGRLTSAPIKIEVKENKETKEKFVITLAVTRDYKNAYGEYVTDYIPIVIFSGIAGNVAEYCKKGDVIGVKGKILIDNNNMEIVADKVSFLASSSIVKNKGGLKNEK